jgi:hypothetical protein
MSDRTKRSYMKIFGQFSTVAGSHSGQVNTFVSPDK